jgi:hypothetical protein
MGSKEQLSRGTFYNTKIIIIYILLYIIYIIYNYYILYI